MSISTSLSSPSASIRHICGISVWSYPHFDVVITGDYMSRPVVTLGAETFARRKIREWTEKLNFFVVLSKRLDPDRNKRERKTLLFQVFVVLCLFFVHQTFF